MNGLADELRLPLYDEILHLTGKLILSQEKLSPGRSMAGL
jgi:hypothetical protein